MTPAPPLRKAPTPARAPLRSIASLAFQAVVICLGKSSMLKRASPHVHASAPSSRLAVVHRRQPNHHGPAALAVAGVTVSSRRHLATIAFKRPANDRRTWNTPQIRVCQGRDNRDEEVYLSCGPAGK